MRRDRKMIVALASVLALAVCGAAALFAFGVHGAPGLHTATPSAGRGTSTPASTPISTHPEALAPGDHVITLQVQGRQRTLILHLPPAAAARRPLPLALEYHGANDTAQGDQQNIGLDASADADGFLTAYLQGYDKSWNDHNGHTVAETDGVDDIAFTRAALAAIEQRVPVDTDRVTAVGFSAGGLFTDLLGCTLSARFSAIVVAEGQLSTKIASTCRLARPISVVQINGSGDPTIPERGGSVTLSGSTFAILSASAAVARWAELDGCAATPQRTSQGTKVSFTTYGDCRAGVSVQLQLIDGGAHTWPSDVGEIVARTLR